MPPALLARVARGDTLVVVRLDRLARSLKHLLELIDRLRAVGAHLRSLRDPIDTSSPQGEFTLQILGAVAQLERSLISQRTKSALAAARKRGRVGGKRRIPVSSSTARRRLGRPGRHRHRDAHRRRRLERAGRAGGRVSARRWLGGNGEGPPSMMVLGGD